MMLLAHTNIEFSHANKKAPEGAFQINFILIKSVDYGLTTTST